MSATNDIEQRLAELERKVANLIRTGTVVAADYTQGKVRVKCDDIVTAWLPWKTRRAGGDVDWWAPEIGEQVEITAPSGLLEAASVSPALYSDAHAEPAASADVHIIRYANGDSITHDRSDGSYTIKTAGPVTVQAEGPALVQTPAATIRADETHITGNLQVDGMVTGKGGFALSGGAGATMSVTGSIQMTGDMEVTGNVHASGDILADGANSNHHSH